MKAIRTWIATALCTLPVAPAFADGLIRQLPPDGSWAEYECHGKALEANGDVSVSLSGTVTVQSVGRETAGEVACRWIEIQTVMKFQRGDRAGEQSDVIALLVPEIYLVSGENPRAHVLRARKRRRQDPVQELDLKGSGARDIESMDEFLHAPFGEIDEKAMVDVTTPAGTFVCKQETGKDVAGDGTKLVESTSVTLLNDKVPFGVAKYRHEKARSENGMSRGRRWVEFQVVKFGSEAKSLLAK